MSADVFALTYPQLARQAAQQGWGDADLARLRLAYELAERMADGLYRAQGMPFLCHLVRTASIVLSAAQPADTVVAALLHSAYMLHCFEGSCRSKLAGTVRRALRRALPAQVEALIAAYNRLPWHDPQALAAYAADPEPLDAQTRQVLLMRLANELEDYLDVGMAYRGGYPFRERLAQRSALLIALAERLGQGPLAAQLRAAFDEHAAAIVPEAAQRGRRHAYELPCRRWAQAGTVERWSRRGARWLTRRVQMNGGTTHAAA